MEERTELMKALEIEDCRDFEVTLRRILCTFPALFIGMIVLCLADLLFNPDKLKYHVDSPGGLFILCMIVLAVGAALLLLEWHSQASFICFSVFRCWFGIYINLGNMPGTSVSWVPLLFLLLSVGPFAFYCIALRRKRALSKKRVVKAVQEELRKTESAD